MIKMSRGYEDERLILRVFLMFVNRADDLGRFGVLSPEHEYLTNAKLSQADIRVFLMSTQYLYDRQIFQTYTLYDKYKKGEKARYYRLEKKKEFNAFYLIIRDFRENKILADKYEVKQKIARDVHLYETGITLDPKGSRMNRNGSTMKET